MASRFDLSILIPVYNEIGSIAAMLEAVRAALPDVTKEIVIVDDGSSDGTAEWLAERFGPPVRESESKGDPGNLAGNALGDKATVKVFAHARNKGKGAALQTALRASTGAVLVVQDADLEYDPSDWTAMYHLIAERKVADVVYGSRFYGSAHRSLYYHHYFGNRLLSRLFNVLYNQTLTDIEVCYKMFTREVLNTLSITASDFGFEIQISAQIALHRRWRIYELGIHYYGRTYDEGKKVRWLDGVKALGYLVRYRLTGGV